MFADVLILSEVFICEQEINNYQIENYQIFGVKRKSGESQLPSNQGKTWSNEKEESSSDAKKGSKNS